MVPHIEKICRGDKTLVYELQGSLCVERGGGIHNECRVAFWIACKRDFFQAYNYGAMCCLQRGCLKLQALLLEQLHQRLSGCQSFRKCEKYEGKCESSKTYTARGGQPQLSCSSGQHTLPKTALHFLPQPLAALWIRGGGG